MRKTTKRTLTLSAQKVRELQSVREVTPADLADVVGGKLYCAGSSLGCINSFTC